MIHTHTPAPVHIHLHTHTPAVPVHIHPYSHRYIVNSLRQEMRLTEYGPTLNPTLNPIVTDSTLERVSICKAIAAELVTKVTLIPLSHLSRLSYLCRID